MIELALKAGLTPTQIVFLDALMRGKLDEVVELMSCGLMEKDNVAASLLVSEAFVELIIPSKGTTLLNLKVTDKTRDLFGAQLSSDEMFDEFVDAYPKFLWINGKRVPALNADMVELQKEYNKIVIKKGKHEAVMKALNWAAKNHEVHMGIKLWLGSRQWKSIEDIMNDESGKKLPGARLL